MQQGKGIRALAHGAIPMEDTMTKRFVSYTICPKHFDPAPGRGHKPAQVGMTIIPTPCLTLEELRSLITELQDIATDMQFKGVHLV